MNNVRTVYFPTRHEYHRALMILGNCWYYRMWLLYETRLLWWFL